MTTWEFSHTSWVIRFYLWFYRADADRITFCSLAWGLLLSPVLLPFRLIGIPVAPMAVRALDRLDDRYMNKPPKQHPRLEAISGWFTGQHMTLSMRIFVVVVFVVAIPGCYYNPWFLFFWTPYFLIMGGYWFGLYKTTAAQFVITGYRSIKRRTCPSIDVK